MAVYCSIIIVVLLHTKMMRLFGWLCFTSHRQRGHLETAPQFTVPCEGREARFLHRSQGKIEPRAVAWQSITPPLRHAMRNTSKTILNKQHK